MPNLYGGYKGIRFEVWKKNLLFDYHRRFLEIEHIYRCSRYEFKKNTIEDKKPPTRLNYHQIWEMVRHIPKIIEVGRSIRLPSYGKSTIRPNKVYSGSYLIGKITWFVMV